ncbi:hypothetical protein ABID19_006676 [Mesorhizobium robiniae]|uniref:Uncharacterized protein n=1 Tax=Mesorhizobium robiniae TaxID=559315 RepID=A0ABV2GZ99_9HYPH
MAAVYRNGKPALGCLQARTQFIFCVVTVDNSSPLGFL